MMWNKRWLWQALQQPPPDGGLWNGRKVADWMSELKGEKVCRLHRVGISQVNEVWEHLKYAMSINTIQAKARFK